MRQRFRNTRPGGHVWGMGRSSTAVVWSPVLEAFVEVFLGLAGFVFAAFGLPRLLDVLLDALRLLRCGGLLGRAVV